MRFFYGLALVLGLIVSAVAACQREPAGAASTTGESPQASAPAAPAQGEKAPSAQAASDQAPGEAAPVAERKTAESGEKKEKKQTDSAAIGRTKKRRKRASATPVDGLRKVVVREGGAKEPAAQIAPGMTPAEAARERQNAEQLLGSTDIRLKDLAARALDAQQRETVEQIRNYMGIARSALKEGDVRRAEMLAQKAQLLAEDLGKH